MSGVVEKIKEKVENVLHKDHITTGTGTHTGPAHHPHGNTTSTNAGPHDTNTGNKLDPRVDSDRDGSRNYGAAQTGPGGQINQHSTDAYGQQSTNAGPHSSNLANKLDPRVDSDRDGSRNYGAAQSGPGGAYNAQSTDAYGQQSTNTGPHSSNLANKMDPRVDSDRDGSRNYGAAQSGPGGAYNSQSTDAYGQQSTNAGPHSSNVANKLDPRVDSDRDGSRKYGAAQTGPGGNYNAQSTDAYGNQSSNHGPHSSNLLNKLDPRVDSDMDGSRNMGAAQTGPGATHNAATGPARDTAGPHGSNMLNRMDPRVDSDASNPNHIHGGNTTY